MGTRKAAWFSFAGTALMWGSGQLGMQWPIPIVWAVTIIGGIGAVVLAVAYYCEVWQWMRAKGLQVGPGIAITICLVGLIGSCIWALFSLKPQQPPNPYDKTVLLECSWIQLPKTVPADGLWWYQLSSAFSVSENVPMATTSLEPGTPMNWDLNEFPSTGYKCVLTNLGSAPALNVEVSLPVEHRQMIKTENGSKSGQVILSQTISSPRSQLGKDGGTSSFYLMNLGPAAVTVTLPKTVRFQVTGSDDWKTANLIEPKLGGFVLPPFEKPDTNKQEK